jgi:LmbE family N-acetylglucosaminyl deacetylase
MLYAAGVPDDRITVDVDVSELYETKLAAIACHRSQIGELERIPRDLRPLHLEHECFVQAWPDPEPGRMLHDLFEGVDLGGSDRPADPA